MILKKPQALIATILIASIAAPQAEAQNRRNTRNQRNTVEQLLSQAGEASRGGRAQMSKTDTALPSSSLGFKQNVKPYNLNAVKPPRSSEIMTRDPNDNRAEYERILDQQIDELYKLTQRLKTSPNRGELWLRLAELYVEKASLIDSRAQDAYDAQLRAFQAGQRKSRPRLNTTQAREYNRKAIQLYEWFQRDFPRDPKTNQALFFLGFNYFELGDTKRGAAYYDRLIKEFPNSHFVGEARFALAEYYFENEKWSQAYREYTPLIKDKKHRLHTFALYKGAWCLFRLGRLSQAMNYLEYIIKNGKEETGGNLAGRRVVNRTRLEGEALRDIVVFYVEGGDAKRAPSYFANLVGRDKSYPYLERLAYQYSDRGNKDASRELFKNLIAQRPTAAKAFDFQYQIVQNYFHAKDTRRFKAELYSWISDYDSTSAWYSANKNNKELIENSYKLRETTLRNYVLQQHQTAQNSRAPFSQAQANEGYQVYLKAFPDSELVGDMQFYYGELLYDMGKFDESAIQYKWVVDNVPQNKFYSRAAQNLILAVERSIPTDEEMQRRAGKTLDPIPLEPKIDRFIKSGLWYIGKFPESEKTVEIKFRIGRLYYQSNHFDEASKYFREIVQQYPRTKHAEYSANLLLDIYNLKKDYAGLEKTAAELLAVTSIANSKAGSDIRNILENASFKRGQELEVEKKYAESAQAFDSFAKQHATSKLAPSALFNAGVNFERAGMNAAAIASYQAVLNSKQADTTDLKAKSRRLLAKQYQDSAQFEEAARLYLQSARENPSDPLSTNMMYNAAILYEVLGRSNDAVRAFNEFIALNKNRSDNVETIFNIAQIHRKAGQKTAAINKYTEYIDKGGRSQEKVVESAYWVSVLYRGQRSITKANEWRKKALAIQKRFAPNSKGVGATFAAKLKLEEAVQTFNEMKAVVFPADPNRQKAAADKKVELLARLNTQLADVIKFDSAEEIVSALSILGEANQNMAEALISAPLPPGLNEEETKQYQTGVQGFAEPFNVKARESFKLAVERGWELEVYSSYYKTALAYMNKVDPKNFYDNGEQGTDIRLINWIGQ